MIEPLLPAFPSPRPYVEELGALLSPLEGLERLRRRQHPVLLLSGLRDHVSARHSILACDPLWTVSIRGGVAHLARCGDGAVESTTRPARDPFDLLRTLAPVALQRTASGLPFAGGAIGYLGYGLRRSLERLPSAAVDPLALPDAWFGLYDKAVVFDHRENRIVLVSTGLGAADEAEREARARDGLSGLRALLSPAVRGTDRDGTMRLAAGRGGASRRVALFRTPPADYLDRVRRALDYIAAGDVYQINLSHRIECPYEGDPLDLFARLDARNPAPFSAFLDAGDFQVACASPERFVGLRGRRAVSEPIKGTRPRGGTPEEDDRLARDLVDSAKDRAENVMIADLVRNDLGRVCETGSVRVERLCALESFATVHHLVSTVTGRLRPGPDRIDLLRALFPGGSMTGAPKVRAMEIIDELEREERGIYAGGIGYLSLDGGLDFNIVIRTLVLAAGRAHLRVGGAIVADSDPAEEHRETLDKARALLDVLDADLA